MTCSNSKDSNDLLIKMIKEQQYWIEKDLKKVNELAELVVSYLEQVRLYGSGARTSRQLQVIFKSWTY